VIKLPCPRIAITTLTLLTLISCGGGGGSNTTVPDTTAPTTSTPDTTPDIQSKSISGGGVKGPLANAVVTVYAFDAAQPGFKGGVVTAASTGADAAITGLALPFPLNPPYIMEFTSNAGTTDITTGMPPVITTMRTVITQALLDNGEQIYATPLTTMAVDIAVLNAVDSNATAGIQADEFETALSLAAAQVVSTLGFGLGSSVDIFDTPPLVDSTTDSTEEQAAVAAYRTAVEAVTAIAWQIDQQTSGGDSDSVLAELAADLADGGGIDGSAGSEINVNTLQVLEQDPATLPIPNTGQTVADVQAILIAETATTLSTTSTTQLGSGGSITTTAKPAQPNPDLDNDGVLNINDQFPTDATADTDSDRDGAPDVAYNDASRTTIDTNRSDPDDDNDGWKDDLDDYPLDNTRFLNPLLDRDSDTVNNGNDNCALTANTNQTDTDGNGQGDACSNDNDGDGVDDSVDNCPIIANPGQEDLDDDAITGGGDACDADIDGDNTANGADAFPRDGNETTDTDGDGLGDAIADSDDDNDGVADNFDTDVAPSGAPSAGIACSLLRDCDGDGVLDKSDLDRTDPLVSVNYAPVANNDTATEDEDATTFAIAVTVNDSDNDGNPNDAVNLSGIGAHNTALGTAAINGNNIDYTPALNASGSDSFSYTVTDGLVSATATVTVTITAVNDDPETTNDPLEVNEDEVKTTDNVLLNDGDVDGDNLSVMAGNPTASLGTVVNNNDGTFTYTPSTDLNGTDSFDYTVTDGNGGSATGTVNVTIIAVNDAAVAVDDADSTDEDTAFTTLNVLLNDSDGNDGGTKAVTAADTTSANGQTVTNNNDGTFGYTPAANFNGTDSFDYIVSDDGGTTFDTGTVTITINPVNDSPVAMDDTDSTNEDVAITTVNVLSNDSDVENDALFVGLFDATSTSGGIVTDNGNGTFNYTPAADFNGDDTFTYTVSDGSANEVDTDIGTVTISVVAVNDPPTAMNDAFNTDEDTALTTLNVLLNDSDGGDGGTKTVTVADATSANGRTVTNNNDGTFSYIPAANFNGTDSFSYTMSDDGGTAISTATVTINVLPIDDPPTGNADAATAAVSTATQVDVLGNDGNVDDDTLSITGVSETSRGSTIVNNGTSVTFTDTIGAGSETFTYDMTDGITTITGILVTMTVIENAPPEAGPDSASTDEDNAVTTGNVLANDSDGGDGGALSITEFDATSANGGSVVDSGNGTFTYTPALNFTGDDTFTYTLSDTFSIVIGTVTITVNSLNDDPIPAEDNLVTDEDTAVTTPNVTLNDFDAEDDSLTVLSNLGASNGVVVYDGNGIFTYTPNANFNGDDSFSYTVEDGNGGSAIGQVNIAVAPINDAPVAVDDSLTVPQNTAGMINLITNDTDVEGDPRSISAVDTLSVEGGSVDDNGDGTTITYTPATNFIGSDSFDYTVEDGNGGSDIGTVNVTVNPPGTAAVMEVLLDAEQGGGIGSIESCCGPSVEFEYWTDVYDVNAASLIITDYVYDYETELFVNDGAADELTLTAGGVWLSGDQVNVVTPNTDDGSMDVALMSGQTTLGTVRLSAYTSDISGELISNYVDSNWAASMINPNATFGAGALEVSQYRFEALSDFYQIYVADWCQDDADLWVASFNNCNTAKIDDNNTLAQTLVELQVINAWSDTNDGTRDSLVAIDAAWDEPSNSNLLIELVTTDNVANYYKRDWNASGAGYIVLLDSGSWSIGDVMGTQMIQLTIPSSIPADFPDLAEDGLERGYSVQNSLVRQVDIRLTGDTDTDESVLNGVAIEEVLANFDPPELPDLVGTWVADIATANGDPVVLHYFANGHYEISGSCADGSTGLESGNVAVDFNTGSFTAVPSIDGRGLCSLPNYSASGATIMVSGDSMTIIVPSYDNFTFSRLQGTPDRLVGSWLIGTENYEGQPIITFLDDDSFVMSEDCGAEDAGDAGFEFGQYSWDQGDSNTVSGTVSIDTNGSCGMHDFNGMELPGDYVFVVTGDTMSLTIPNEGTIDFNRHAPAPVITPAIAYETLLDTFPKTLTYVWYDRWTDFIWKSSQATYADDGTFTRLGPDANGDPVVVDSEIYRYQIINGVYYSSRQWYGMALSYDATLNGYFECYQRNYQDLNDCGVGDSEWVFDNATDASNFRNAENAAATPVAVDASTVFDGGTIHYVELNEYAINPETWVGTPLYGTFDGDTGSGILIESEFRLIDNTWTENPDYFDIALVTSVGATATVRNMIGQEIVAELDMSFGEIDISGQSLLTHVDPELFPFMEYGSFSSGARLYETTITFNQDYFIIGQWDGCDGAFNGNCNTAWLRDLDRNNGTVGAVTATQAVNLDFINDINSTIEVGYGQSRSLVAVFAEGGVLELWEVDWNSGSTAVNSGNNGSWTQRTLKTETLIDIVIPAIFSQNNGGQYDIGDDYPRFFSVHNGYLRHGEVDNVAGETEIFPMFNQTAFQNIRDSISP
jgi:hypothetical protein